MCQPRFDRSRIPTYNLSILSLVYLFTFIFAMLAPLNASAVDTEEMGNIPEKQVEVSGPTNNQHQKNLYRLLVAEMAAQRQMSDIALKNFLEVAKSTEDPDIAKEATEWAIEFQLPEQALQASALWASTAPDDLQAQMVAATLVIGQSINEAMPYLTRAIELDPKEIGQHIVAIQSRLSPRSAENLKMALYRIAAKRNQDPYANLAAALSAVQQEDIESANRWTDKTLGLMPDLTQAVELKAKLIRHGDTSDSRALKFLKDHLSKYPSNAELRLFYASALLDANQLKEALSHLKQLTANKEYGGQALLLLGEVYRKEGQIPLAFDSWKKASTYASTETNARYLLGELSEQQGKVKDAINWYTSIDSGNFHIPAQVRAAELLKESKKYDEAIHVLHESSPTSLEDQKDILLAEIDILMASKQFNDAQTLADEVLEKIPGDEDFLLARSQALAKLKQWGQAEKDLNTILKQNANNAIALNALGNLLLLQNGRNDEAKQYLEQALSIAPNNPIFLDSVGWYYFRTGEPEKALPYLKQANKLSAEPEIAAHLGEVLWVIGKKEQAKAIWSEALSKTPENEVLKETMARFKADLKPMNIVHH